MEMDEKVECRGGKERSVPLFIGNDAFGCTIFIDAGRDRKFY